MKHLFFICLLLTTLSCKEHIEPTPVKPEYIDQDKTFSEVVFDCENADTSSITTYFQGTLSGKPFCTYDGVTGHEAYEGLITSFLSSSPVFNTNGSGTKLVRQLWLGFGIFKLTANSHSLQFTSSITQDSTLKDYVENHFIEDKQITILDLTNSGGAPYDKVEGFIINLYARGTFDRSHLGQISTSYGTQRGKTYFKPVIVKKGSLAGFPYYDLVFDLRCELYKYRYGNDPDALYGVLEGKYHTRIWI
jgi:hypothetical protein